MSELLDRIRGALIGFKMPRALEAVDQTLSLALAFSMTRRLMQDLCEVVRPAIWRSPTPRSRHAAP
jgi:hypothetical protein